MMNVEFNAPDYDVAVFVADLEDRRAVDHALSDLDDRPLLSGFHISPVSMPSNFLERPVPGTLASFIKRDGVPIS